MNNQIFETIKNQCPQKKIISLCNKLIKKCSFKSGKDAGNLCHLSYWLYLYEKPELAFTCIALTKPLVFNHDFLVWDYILCMWGLEARILREQGRTETAQAISEKIIDCYLAPINPNDTRETMMKRWQNWIDRHTLSFIDLRDKIDESLQDGDTKQANEIRFIALITMIGKLESGLFPNLNNNRNEVNVKINEYISAIMK
jgi:hypothetical protein